jgi:hypothetical protein
VNETRLCQDPAVYWRIRLLSEHSDVNVEPSCGGSGRVLTGVMTVAL